MTDPSVSEDQRLVAEAAADWLADAAAMARVRAFAEGDEPLDRGLWQGLIDQGWCGLPWPEALGGSGLGWLELALVAEQLGRRLAPVPFFDSVVLSGSVLQALVPAVPAAEALLRQLAAGALVATVALEVPADARLATGALAGAASGRSPRLSGRWPLLAWATAADLLLLPAHEADGTPVLLALPPGTPGLRCRLVRSVDPTRRLADIEAAELVLPSEAVLARGGLVPRALAWARDLGAIALAAEQVGAARQCLDLTVAYALQREQFGQPVGRFQAVKHRGARMLVAVEGARSAVLGAAAAAEALRQAPIVHGSHAAPDAADPAAEALGFHAAHARCEATAAAQYCSAEAIQLHGGVGYTWDYDPQLYFKRAQADSQRLKSPAWWRERVAARLLDD